MLTPSPPPGQPQLAILQTSAANPLVEPVRAALNLAFVNRGKLDAYILAIEGMSGRKYRLFINNLIGSLADPRYLEVGVWLGSTLCSAVYKNKAVALGIDNWSQFGGSPDRAVANLGRFVGDSVVRLVDSDFRRFDFAKAGKFNIYLFDGLTPKKTITTVS